LSRKLRSIDGGFMHWCPACGGPHGVNVTKPNGRTGAKWSWDGNVDAPTCSPSILCFTETGGKRVTLCHYFLKHGNIEFCADCPHALAGKVVPLPDWPKEYGTES
jgi:hypothetical protein